MMIPRKIYTNRKSQMIEVKDILNATVKRKAKLIASTTIKVLKVFFQNIMSNAIE